MKTQDLILHHARKLFAKEGFDGTSTQMIADRVGIKKASLYYFFKNKESIYLKILEAVIYEIQETFEDGYQEKRSFVDVIEEMLIIDKKNGPVIFSLRSISTKQVTHVQKLFIELSSSITQYLTLHPLRCSPSDTLMLLFDITQSYARNSAEGHKTLSPKKYAQLITALLIK